MAVNAERTKYVTLTDIEIQKCTNPSITYCSIRSAVYPINLSKLCVVALFMRNEDNVNRHCQTIVKLNSMLPLANYLSNGVWIIITLKDLMFSVVCQDTRDNLSVIYAKPPIAKVKLELTCSAFNDYLTLLPYYHKQTKYLVEESLNNLIKTYNISTKAIWKPFNKALPKFEKLNFPKELKSIEHIPMDNLIDKLKNLNVITQESGTLNWGHYLGWLAVILATAFFIFIYCKYFRKRKFKICWLAKSRTNKNESGATPEYGMVSAAKTEGAVSTSREVFHSAPLTFDARNKEPDMKETVTNVVKTLYPMLDLNTSGSVKYRADVSE